MSGNRVEELEARVRELQATVDGLTDELLETKERLRVIEEEVDPDLDPDIIEGQLPSGPETQTARNGAKAKGPENTSGERGESTSQADRDPEEGTADGDKSDESEKGDTDSADDIIVA